MCRLFIYYFDERYGKKRDVIGKREREKKERFKVRKVDKIDARKPNMV